MTDFKKLTERVCMSPEPDRELDCDIALAIPDYSFEGKPKTLHGMTFEEGLAVVRGNPTAVTNFAWNWSVPHFTASVDAILKYTPDEWMWQYDDIAADGMAYARLHGPGVPDIQGIGANEVMARLAAMLGAYDAKVHGQKYLVYGRFVNGDHVLDGAYITPDTSKAELEDHARLMWEHSAAMQIAKIQLLSVMQGETFEEAAERYGMSELWIADDDKEGSDGVTVN